MPESCVKRFIHRKAFEADAETVTVVQDGTLTSRTHTGSLGGRITWIHLPVLGRVLLYLNDSEDVIMAAAIPVITQARLSSTCSTVMRRRMPPNP